MKIALIVFIYLLIGFVSRVIYNVHDKLNGNYGDLGSDDTLLMCLLWIVIVPLFLLYKVFEKLNNAGNAISNKIYKWIEK